MIHAFDTELANPETGGSLAQAVIAESLRLWIAYNRATERNRQEDRWWTYCSIADLRERHPYLSTHQIRHALDTLAKRGILLRGRFSRANLDRRWWYAFADESALDRPSESAFSDLSKTANGSIENGKSIVQEPQIDCAKTANAFVENGKSYKEQVLNPSTYGEVPPEHDATRYRSQHQRVPEISEIDDRDIPEEPDSLGLLNRTPPPAEPPTPEPAPPHRAPRPTPPRPSKPTPPPGEAATDTAPAAKPKRAAPVAKTPEGAAKQACVGAYHDEFLRVHGLKPIILGRQAGEIGRVVTQLRAVLECDWPAAEAEFVRLLGVFFATDWLVQRGSTTSDLAAQINALRGAGATNERRDEAGNRGYSANGPGRYREAGSGSRGRITEEQLAINREKIRQWTDPNWRPRDAWVGPSPFTDGPA